LTLRSRRGSVLIPRSTHTLAAALFVTAAVISLAPFPTSAQETTATPADEISCKSDFGNAVELDKSSFRLVPATAEESASVRKSKPELSAGPFSGGKFAYDRVEIYLVQTKEGEPDSVEATLSLYARGLRDQKESWFKFAPDRHENMGISDFFDLTIGDTGDDSGQGSDEKSSPGVSLAVQKMNVPIFTASWWKHESGASTFAEVQKLLLLDFRTSPPGVMTALQCVHAEGGGACGVYDNGSAPTTTLTCNWDSAKSDFLCNTTKSGDYIPPLTHRTYLASGADAPYSAKEGDPPTLNTLAAWSTYDRSWAEKRPDIPGLGAVTVLGKFSRTGARDAAVLLASRGHDSLEPRYFAVVVDSQGPTTAFEILPQPLVDAPETALTTNVPSAPDTRGYVVPASINASKQFASDDPPSFQAQILESLPNVTLWQVTAKQGTSHEIVWLAAGFNSANRRYVFSGVRIASELGEYASCGSTRTGPFAASIERKKGSLEASLDVEPSHQYGLERNRQDSDDQGQPVTPCPMKVRIFWNPSLGFVREESDPECSDTTRARSLSISDDGVITAKPDDSENSQ
jgi:hypothetical protein